MLTVDALAKSIDHALLQPALSDLEFEAGCELAKRWSVAAVCVKSVDVGRARTRLCDSSVAVCAVIGFPHANVPIEVMRVEAQRALADGATEIDAVVNLSRVLSNDWNAVAHQIGTLCATAKNHRASLKVIFEIGLIAERQQKVRLCEICNELEVAFVKTSTGFATGRDPSGQLVQLGATLPDVQLLVQHAGRCRVKASGGIRTLNDALAFVRAGAARLGTTSTEAILAQATATMPH